MNKTFNLIFQALLISGLLFAFGCKKDKDKNEPVPANIETLGSASITDNSAILKGKIVKISNPPQTERGFFYSSTNQNPTAVNGSTNLKVVDAEVTVGEYSATASALTPNTTYYWCAYSKAGDKYEYGSVKNFKTKTGS